jgi:hypothetical protein
VLGAALAGIAIAFFVAISDPDEGALAARRWFRRYVAADVGRLFFEPDRLRYVGDALDETLPRKHFIELERQVDKGDFASYSGARPIVLRWREGTGQERRLRLHGEGNWTGGAEARALEALARRIASWRDDGQGAAAHSPE